MNKLISISIKHRWIIAAIFILLGAFGYFSWKQLAIDAYPDIADVTVQVITQVPGLAAEEIEQQITIPIERELNGMPGLVSMRSKNTFGLSSIILVFEDGVDDYWARQRVQERLADIELPFGATPGLNPLTSPTGEIYRYIIESNNHDLRELTDLNKWVIIPRLKQVTGVADVSNFGGITTQFQVELNPKKLEQYNLSLADITEKIEKNNSNAGGSMFNRGDLSFVIRGIGLVKDLNDLGKVVVRTVKGVPIYLDDLGELKYGTLERKGVLGFTDKKRNYSESVEGIVQMLRGQNPSKVLDGIHAAVDELNSETLPEGVVIHPFLDRTDLVNTTLRTVSHTLLFGMFLVLLILIVFLGSWRGALIVSITIPFSLLIAFILMHLTKIPANLLSLGAIDFGIIIEGSIITMETILKRREDHPELRLETLSIIERVNEVAKPVFFSTIIIITAYLPLFAFERIEKKLFTPMAYTLGYALIGALFVALLLTPGLTFAMYRKPQKTYHNRWLRKLSGEFVLQTRKILNKPKQIFLPVAFILVTTVILCITVGKDFLPNLDEGSLWLQIQLPPGISLEKAKAMSDTLRQHIIKHDEITYVMAQTGRDDEGAESFSKSHTEFSIGLKPYKEWKNGKKKMDLIEDLAKEFDAPALAQPQADPAMAVRIRQNYRKLEVRIPVRDGVKLFTSIYVPRDTTRRYPVLMSRTPYSVAPYGDTLYKTALGPSNNPRWVDDRYIFVYQDARGRHFSEGVFREMMPLLERHEKPTDVDEGTDTYDTIEWLLKNLPTNGKMGLYGTSYPGFYASASCLSRHPALVACSPQAPMTDIWMGDDDFHGGAFLLPHNFGFYRGFNRGPRTEPGFDKRYPFSMGTPDAYQFYLDMGPVGPGSRKYLAAGTAPSWEEMLNHPTYDAYWQARNVRPHLHDVKAAVLTVGGFYDTEDIHGPWWVYGSIATQSPATENTLIVGPWSHGGWSRGDGTVLGNLRWNYKTGPFFRDSVEYPFFAHHLAGGPRKVDAGVLVFRTGADKWDHYPSWPAPDGKKVALYLQPDGKLGFSTPAQGAAFDQYVSDPAKPVPLVDRIEGQGMPRDYITADQRFASRRPDVLVYQTDVLAEDMTLSGPLHPVLHVSTTGTDADFIVKLIDVFPNDAPNWAGDQSGFLVGGYQQLVRGEPFRARYRRSFEKPSPMVANQADSIRFEMPSIHHTFRKGHRIMVQVQSTWFPHIDRNPQTYVPNIFFAKPGDFKAATMRVYHSAAKPTRIELLQVP